MALFFENEEKQMAENKVQFNLKNVYYAPLTEGTTPTWTTPVAMPGAVNLSLSANGELTPFYADGIVYYSSVSNNGYEGDLELARVPDSFLTAICGMTLGSTSKVITERSTDTPVPFALLFQIDGDSTEQCYCLYKCTATRPQLASATNTETKEPQTQTLSIASVPLADGRVLARTTDQCATATITGWFSTVFQES